MAVAVPIRMKPNGTKVDNSVKRQEMRDAED